jgi:signal transduction histidine kinase
MPHGHCYLWKPALVWLQVLSNGLIGLAYVSISATLAYLVYRVRDIPFKLMYLAFGIFIVTCGFTHFMDVWVIWEPRYWLDGALRAVTAIASVGTALMLPPLVPKAIALARGARAAHVRGIQLETAVKDLATMYERTKELDEQKTQFFANVSHELRTPIALILGPVEKLLAAGALDERQRGDLEVVARNARALLKHVNDLLDLSKLDAGQLEARYSETDVARLVRLVAADFEAVARDRSIRLVVDAPPALRAEVDPDKVQRILLNLLSNAFKFTPAGGTIRCVARAAEGAAAAAERLEILVSDSGPGVRPADRALIFERFRQGVVGSTRQGGGTGLGLSIAQDFARRHGGGITVVDAPEGGALFRVELPTRAPAGREVERGGDAPGLEPVMARATIEQLSTRARERPREADEGAPLVLVVEDNPEMSRFVADAFAGAHRVAVAADGQEGFERAIALRPDLVITDVMMPRMSGDQLTLALRARPELDGTPILVLTARADDELRIRLLREGAQDYVMKPFSAEELRARAANLIMMKRARDILRSELDSQLEDLTALSHEVTSRKRELETALEAMRIARDQAARAAQARSDFLNLVSHELRTPLTSIQLQLDRMERDTANELTEKQRTIFRRISVSTRRLTDLVDSLLEYAAAESGRLAIRRGLVDVQGLLTATVDELAPRAERKGLRLAHAGGEPAAPLHLESASCASSSRTSSTTPSSTPNVARSRSRRGAMTGASPSSSRTPAPASPPPIASGSSSPSSSSSRSGSSTRPASGSGSRWCARSSPPWAAA